MTANSKLTPEDQHLFTLVKLSPLPEEQKKKLELLIPDMTDAQKLKLLSIVTTQIVMQMEFNTSRALEKTVEEIATNPNKPYNEEAFSDAVNKVWQDFVSRKSGVKDQTQISDVRASLQSLQDKLKKISDYANSAQNDLSKHL